jgi:Tol biopolymer transport system component
MTTATHSIDSDSVRALQTGYPAGSIRFDWLMIAVSAWLIGGLFVDGWAHFHGMVDDSFFTPWHAVFYSGFASVAIFLGINQWRNVSKGFAFWRALPQGYALSLVGAGIFALAGVGDLIWHTVFGIEIGTEALLSPTHLLLATGMVLITSGPLRAAWHRVPEMGWRMLAPMLLSATLLLAVLAFFTSYAHPFVDTWAAVTPSTSSDPGADLYIMNTDGTGQTRLSMSPGSYGWTGDWSPDGSQIVFQVGVWGEEAVGQSDLYIIDADASYDLTRFTQMDGEEFTPSWSPDGSQITFVYRTAERSDIYTMLLDGGEPVQLTDTPDGELSPVWSPDGEQIIFTLLIGEGAQIYTMQPDGSSPTPLTSEGVNWGGSFSPDGSHLVFTSYRAGSGGIFLMNADGSDQTPLITSQEYDVGSPAWSPDGNQIVFRSWRSGNSELYVVNADCMGSAEGCEAQATNLVNNPALETDNPVFSPDGSKILYTGQGHGASSSDSDMGSSLGIASVLLQSALMMGLVLLITRHWTLPFGALTLIFTLSNSLITVLTDQYNLLPAVVVGGLLADVLVFWLKPSSASMPQYTLFAFLVPVVFYSLYFAVLQLTQGIGWTIHFWAGAIFLAGVVGLLMSVLIAQRPTSPGGV